MARGIHQGMCWWVGVWRGQPLLPPVFALGAGWHLASVSFLYKSGRDARAAHLNEDVKGGMKYLKNIGKYCTGL